MEQENNSNLSRRRFIALTGTAGLTLAMGGMLTGCGSGGSPNPDQETADLDYDDWDAVLAAAKGQTVTWYGWGGSEPRNSWVDDTVAPLLKEKYDITLDRVGMDINDILTQLSGEMQAGVQEGSIDFIWINGENFFSTKKNGYLWGPFTAYLPNFDEYCDAEASDIAYDFGSPTEGYEAPYGKAQMQMWVDGAKYPDPPHNPDEFLKFCQDNSGKVTYPQPGDFTGTAFISCLIAGVIGKDEFEKLSMMTDPEVDEVKAIIEPGLAYLRSLNPYLWNGGETFPSDSTTVGTMFADGEIIMNMGYGDPQSDVENGIIPETVKSFLFDTGTVGNTNFMAVAANAPHKAAALVAINEVLSPELQLSQYEDLGTISVFDMDKLPADVQNEFETVELGSTQLPISDLLAVRVTEASGPAIPLIEQLWLDEVVCK